MGNETYTPIAYIGVLNEDDSLQTGIPLYVKVSGDMSPARQKLIQDIASDMIRHYGNRLSKYVQQLQADKRGRL